MRATLSLLKSSRIAQTIGVCATSDEFLSIINEAQQRLILRGNFKGSYQRFRICTENECITLPRQIATVLELQVCNYNTPIRNMWWEFLPNQGYHYDGECGCGPDGIVDRGYYPTFRDISGTNKRLRLYPTVASDVGKVVHIFGNDGNNQWIRTETSPGVFIDGFQMTLAMPFVDSSFDVSSVTGFQKVATNGNVLLYYVDTVSGEQVQMGFYEPDETVAEFRRYHIGGIASCSGCSDTSTLIGIAKLDFIPVQNDWDYLFIDNVPAIKMMAQSIRMGEMDSDSAQRQSLLLEAKAVKELNQEKRNINPDPSIRLNTMGTATLNRMNIGRLV